MTSPSYHLTYAEQLRGRRFWLPVVGLVAATVVGVQLQASQYAAPVTSASSVLASDSLDVSLRTALTALGASGLPCQAPTTSSVTAVTCDFGVPATRVDFRSFGSHRLTVKALSAAEKSVGAQSGKVAFLVAGKRWIATGSWSQDGQYETATTPGATVAQQISSELSGCLELLPRDHGSCRY